MDIDWVTVGAQVVNFLVLVWLLQHFLYRPITRAMERREQRIADRLAAADTRRLEAEAVADAFRQRQDELDEERESLIAQAHEDANTLRHKLETEARDEVEVQRRAWRAQIEGEADEFLDELRTHTARHIHKLARTAFAELAGSDLQSGVAARFIDQLNQMDRGQLDKMAQALARADRQVLVESSIDLTATTKDQIIEAAHRSIAPDLAVSFAQVDDLLLGIRLSAGGQTVEWSLSRYLDRLESAVEEKLAQARTSFEREPA